MTIDMNKHVDALGQLVLNKGWADVETIDEYRRHRINDEWLPTNGARLCAKAWTDPRFKQFLLTDGKAAAAVDGIQHGFRVIVPRECVGDRNPDPHRANLFDIDRKYGGVVARSEVIAYFEMNAASTEDLRVA